MHDRSSGWADRTARTAVTALLFALPALVCIHIPGSCAIDPDVGWQIRTGAWILHHHAFPRTDPFSRTRAGASWQAYSWLFDLMLLRLWNWLGMNGLVLYTAVMAAAITAAVYRLVSRFQPDFIVGAALTLAAVLCVSLDFTPRPWLFSILFFIVELDILLQYRRSLRPGILLWLPPIFALWANLHIQFIDGLLALGIAASAPLLSRWLRWSDSAPPARPLWIALAACVAAPLLNPYGLDIYRDAWIMGSQPGVLSTVGEMHALAFRSFRDYLLLFLALASAALLFRRRRPALFSALLLAMSVVLSFRSQRDAWILAVVAVALIAASLRTPSEQPAPPPSWTLPVSLVAAAAFVAVGFPVLRVDNAHLLTVQAESLPVQAVAVVRQRHYPGPLFNNYDWGGFLIWQLGMPVSIDGRAGLYGDADIDRSIATWGGGPQWASDPALQSARLVIAPVGAALTQLLRLDPRFQLAYQDKVAAVFVARGTHAPSRQ